MAVKTYKFREIEEINYFLEGAIMGADLSKFGADIVTGGGGKDFAPVLAGLTLIFTSPSAVTVTFAKGADPAGRLLPKEIKQQVEAADALLKVFFFEGRIVFAEATPSLGVALSASGTANSALGFGSNLATVGKFYNSPYGSTPTTPYVMFTYSVNDNMHVVQTWE